MLKNSSIASPVVLALGSIFGLIAFTWPLYIPDSQLYILQPDAARTLALLIAAIAVLIVALEISRGALDSKAVAVLGVLTALVAALRLVGAGAVGVEPMWFFLIIASYAFGATFGFSLGVLGMAVSAALTGGIGNWLPFQMLAAGWIGLIAGSFNGITKLRQPRLLLATWGVFASLLFGILMDLQSWPWLTGIDTQLSYISGAAVMRNFERFMGFHFATALAWDIPRAITTAALIWLTANPVLNSLQRAKLRLHLA